MFFPGLKLTAFEEEELKKKWQEILGPSNEVVVSHPFKMFNVILNSTELLSSGASCKTTL